MTDFRSDTVTQPSRAMREAMLAAPLGDDVFGDDPSVQALQSEAAELLGFEAALLVPSGTQSNLIALMAQCERGDEVIVGQWAHAYRWEAGGMAVLGSIQPQPVENAPDGTLPLARVQAAIKPDDPHFARTRMLALENTFNGKVLPADYLGETRQLAKTAGLRLHLDGARLFNAAVAQAGTSTRSLDSHGKAPDGREQALTQARLICSGFDSVSVCLSKGLGCPIGSLLLASKETVARARRLRKMLGGGMRQAGLFAAAGQYALTNNIARLDDDHRLAARFASELGKLLGCSDYLADKVTVNPAQTNMVFVELDSAIASPLARHLNSAGLRFTSSPMANGLIRQRWVTHLDVDDADVDTALTAWASWRPEA